MCYELGICALQVYIFFVFYPFGTQTVKFYMYSSESCFKLYIHTYVYMSFSSIPNHRYTMIYLASVLLMEFCLFPVFCYYQTRLRVTL